MTNYRLKPPDTFRSFVVTEAQGIHCNPSSGLSPGLTVPNGKYDVIGPLQWHLEREENSLENSSDLRPCD